MSERERECVCVCVVDLGWAMTVCDQGKQSHDSSTMKVVRFGIACAGIRVQGLGLRV